MITHKRRKDLTPEDFFLANVGQNYWEANLRDLPDSYACKRTLTQYGLKIVQYLRAGNGLLLFGPNSHGKTHAACALLKEAIRHAAKCLFLESDCVTSARIDNTPFDAMPGWSLLARARDVDLLVLDDLGAEHVTAFDQRCVEGLLRYRINRNKATIVTTNLEPRPKEGEKIGEFEKAYGRSLKRVLEEKILPVLVSGTDWRARKKRELANEFRETPRDRTR